MATPDTTIPLIEETARVQTRPVDRGVVRISKTVEVRETPVNAVLQAQDVHVERIPIGRMLPVGAPLPEPRHEGATWVLPVLREIVVTQTRTVLVEEVRVERRAASRVVSETVPLRQEHIHITAVPASGTSPSSLPYPGAIMTSTVVGIFDTHAQADQARQELLNAGFDASSVSLTAEDGGGSTGASDTSSGQHENAIVRFFKELFGTDDEQAHGEYGGTYREAFRRGSCALSVRTSSDDEVDRAERLLNQAGAVDIDERSQQWRAEGWTGGSAGSTRGHMDSTAAAVEDGGTLAAGALGSAGGVAMGTAGTRGSGGMGTSDGMGSTGAMGSSDGLGAGVGTGSTGGMGTSEGLGASGATGGSGSLGSSGTLGGSDALGTSEGLGASGATGSTGSLGSSGTPGGSDALGSSGGMGTTGGVGADDVIGAGSADGSLDGLGTEAGTGAPARTGAMGTAGTNIADGALGTPDDTGARERTRGTAMDGDVAPGETRRLQEIQEDLVVGKRAVSRGGVRVFARMTETPVSETVTLREEVADVQRRTVDRPATEADLAAFREGSVEIRETREEAVVDKTARVVGEVEIGKQVIERQETIDDTVRKTEVQVEPLKDPQR